jgi:pimeloyl-ACP methyl ester carboxylesterase
MPAFDHTRGTAIDVDGARIHAEAIGSPDLPVLLLLHGGLGTLEDFNAIADALAGYRLVALDSRGHGASTLGDAAWTYRRVQEDVEQVLAKLGIARCTVMGFSDGGIVGLRLAAEARVRVERLVTIGATWHPKNLDATRPLLEKVTADSWRGKFPESWKTYERLNPAPDFDRLVPAVVSGWLDEGPTGHPGDAVERIACPTLVVRGDDDHLTAPEDSVELCARLPDAHFLNIPFAGHVAHEDGKSIFLEALHAFLRQSATA